MKPKFKWTILAASAVLCAWGFYATSRTAPPAGARARLDPAILAPLQRDQALLQRANTLAPLAETPHERALAAQARHLADEMVDMSFTIAMNQAAAQAPRSTPESKMADARVRRVQATVASDQAALAKLRAAPGSAAPSALDIAEAQLELDQARLTDASADAARTVTGAQDQIERLRRQHEAQHTSTAAASSAISTLNGLTGDLVRGWNAASQLRALEAAEANARAALPSILDEHNTLLAAFTAARHQAEAAPPGPGRALQLRALAAEQVQVSRFDQQDDTDSALADVYHAWQPLVARREQAALHAALGHTLALLTIFAALFLLLTVATRALRHPRLDRHRATTLVHMSRLVIEVVGLLAVLVVIFGRPPQLLTILGLAGAGLTLAFQDTIMSLAGWFVLVGRSGVRLGDWLEIGGVVGEVVDIRLLKTELLETGNWITAGHPTGRRVFFPNSFALKGSFFNYSETGQWIWDEVQAPLPAALDPRVVLARISERLASDFGAVPVSAHGLPDAQPSAQLRPAGDTFILVVRYPTPAARRAAQREHVWSLITAALASAHAAPAG